LISGSSNVSNIYGVLISKSVYILNLKDQLFHEHVERITHTRSKLQLTKQSALLFVDFGQPIACGNCRLSEVRRKVFFFFPVPVCAITASGVPGDTLVSMKRVNSPETGVESEGVNMTE
jgi:hypothetical protein